MPSTASGLPYPTSTDTPDVPRDIKALADALEARLPRASWSGQLSVPVSAANNATAAVTFPAGKFTAAPNVVVSTSGTSFWAAFSSGITASGFTATVRHIDATVATATPSVHYTATQN
jgi:hypothetical protein